MEDKRFLIARSIAFVIDAVIIAFCVLLIDLWVIQPAYLETIIPSALLYFFHIVFFYVPFLLFFYWSLNINIGKRLFKLEIVDAKTRQFPSQWQLFIRAVSLSFLAVVNLLMLLPASIVQKRHFIHDVLAGTHVIRKN